MSKIIKMSKNKNKPKKHTGLIGLFLFLLAICFLLISPFFEIDNIRVEGNNNVLENYIISTAGVSCGQNIFRLNKFEAIERIIGISQIKEASISRQFPNSIVIRVTENDAIAYSDFYGSKLILSDDGIVLRVITDKEEVNLPKLTGITVRDVITGEKLICDEEEILEKYLEVLKCLNKNDILKNVRELSYLDGVLVWFLEGDIAFLGETDNLEYKILSLISILEKEINPSYIDLHILEKIVTKPAWGMFSEKNVSEDIENE